MVFFADNLKRSVWVASNTVTNGVRQFAAPVARKWNWRTMSSDAEMMTYGAQYTDYCLAILPVSEVAGLSVFDRIWHTTPAAFDPFAMDAEFEINSIVEGAGGVARVTYKRLTRD